MERCNGRGSPSVLSTPSCMEPKKTDRVVDVEPTSGLSASCPLSPQKRLSEYRIALSPLKAFGSMVGSAHDMLGKAASCS